MKTGYTGIDYIIDYPKFAPRPTNALPCFIFFTATNHYLKLSLLCSYATVSPY